MRVISGCAALLAVATLASADVRVRTHGAEPYLDVQASSRGIWSVLNENRPGVALNPGGDNEGDGYPAHAANGSRLVAAWHRASTRGIVVSGASDGEIAWQVALDSPGITHPAVARFGPGFLVAWTSDAGNVVAVQVEVESGELTPVELQAGKLLAVEALGTGAVVVSIEPITQLLRVVHYFPAPQPYPIPGRSIEVAMVSVSSRTIGSTAVPTPCLSSEPTELLLAWPSGRGSVTYVIFRADGTGDSSVVATRVQGCGGILQAVRREN